MRNQIDHTEGPETDQSLVARKDRLLALMHHKDYVPMKVKELAILLGVPKEERPRLQAVLDVLLAEGKIGISKRGKYALAENFLVRGTFIGNRKGFGFVAREPIPGKEKESDIFVAEQDSLNAMDGDTVQVVLLYGKENRKRKNPEGRVVRVLERAHREVVATYEKCRHFGFAVPINQRLGSDIFIP